MRDSISINQFKLSFSDLANQLSHNRNKRLLTDY
jgi:hypothetical protein